MHHQCMQHNTKVDAIKQQERFSSMNITRLIICVLLIATLLACSPAPSQNTVNPTDFFQTPPKAERGILSDYESPSLKGKTGIRIELEPLSFLDPETKRELEPDLLLEYLILPSTDPAKLAHTRHKPDANYEGSFYFLAEHNRVDLKEIRFLNAKGNLLQTEYDLVIHLPKSPPNEYPITILAETEIKVGAPKLEPPRTIQGLGELVQEKEYFWKGNATYAGHPVEIEFYAEPDSFDEIAAFTRAVLSGESLPSEKLDALITEGIKSIEWKLKEFDTPAPRAEDFSVRRFYVSKRRHHPNPNIIIGLSHPEISGHWTLTISQADSGSLNWVPKQ